MAQHVAGMAPAPHGLSEWSRALAHDPGSQAFWILRIGFTVAPIVAGIDKFFNELVDWRQYLARPVADLFGATGFMYFVGVVEVIAGIGVAIWPRVFGYIVALWLLGIIVNLLVQQAYYDVALRDLGLCLGALALARLSHAYAGTPRTNNAA